MKFSAGLCVDRSRYVLLDPLGEGGQGSVWKVEDRLNPGRFQAVKLVPLAQTRPKEVERMRREAHALAGLRHASLVACQGLFEDLEHGVLGLSMDYVPGVSLRKLIGDARYGAEHRVLLLIHAAKALAYVHEQGLVHRDLKLDNVLVTDRFLDEPRDPKNVKLVDFGIAALTGNPEPLTAQHSVIGTLAYLAPELLEPEYFGGTPSSPPADVYGFGVVAYLVLAGEHPSGLGEHATAVQYCMEYRRADREGNWPARRLEGAWGELLAHAVALRPALRLASGSELAQRCEELRDVPVGGVTSAGAVTAAAFLPTVAAKLPGARLEPAAGTTAARREPEPVFDGAPPVANATAARAVASSEPSRAGLVLGIGAAALLVGALVGVGLRWYRPPPTPPKPGPVEPTTSASASALLSPDAGGAALDASSDAEAAGSTLPPACAADAGLCACCPSGRDCAPGGCDLPLDLGATFSARVAHVESSGGYRMDESSGTQVCVRALTRDSGWSCARLGDPTGRLTITGSELGRTGLDVKVEQIARPDVTARARYREAPTRLALCKGLSIAHFAGDLQIESVQLYVDEVVGDAGSAVSSQVCPP